MHLGTGFVVLLAVVLAPLFPDAIEARGNARGTGRIRRAKQADTVRPSLGSSVAASRSSADVECPR